MSFAACTPAFLAPSSFLLQPACTQGSSLARSFQDRIAATISPAGLHHAYEARIAYTAAFGLLLNHLDECTGCAAPERVQAAPRPAPYRGWAPLAHCRTGSTMALRFLCSATFAIEQLDPQDPRQITMLLGMLTENHEALVRHYATCFLCAFPPPPRASSQ